MARANAMLQWMGGSRRKVSTNHYKQKQYFEQRKRRNQDIGLENYADGRNKRAPQHEEPRSLDILSLRNVAAVAQECEPVRIAMVQGCRSGCSFNGDNPEVDNTQVYCNALKHSLAIPVPTNKVHPEDFSYLNEATLKAKAVVLPNRVSGSTHPESAPSCHKCAKAIAPDEQKRTSKNGIDMNFSQICPWKKLSVIDILDDCKVHACSEQRSEHEAHVAFSVRGLGQIGSETPVRSPMETNGVFFNGFPSPPKAAKRLHASVNFQHATVDLEAELAEVFCSLQNRIMHNNVEKSDSPFKSSAVTDCLGYSRSTEFINRRFMPLDAIDFSSKNFINEDKIFCSGINERNEQICNARFGFLDDKFLDKRKQAVSEMIEPFQVEYDTSRSLRAENHEICDYEFAKQFASEKNYEMIALDDERSYLNKESYNRHKFDTLHDHIPPAGCFIDQDVLQPVCSAQSNESQSFSSIRSGWMKPDIQLASVVEGQPPSSSFVFDLEKDDEVHNVSWRDFGYKGKDVLSSVPTNYRQPLYEQPKGVSIGSSDLSSGNGKSADFVDFKDSCSEHGEADDRNLEPIESSKARNSSEDGEETPDTIERPAKLKECINIQQ
ncbi:hypothetical protein ACLOJK_012227 [Asimina triloba]